MAKFDFTRANGTIKRVQVSLAFRAGTSSMGTKFKQNEPVLHLSSSRSTGEVFVLTRRDMNRINRSRIGKWAGRPTK